MNKEIIKHNEKEYQLSMVYLDDFRVFDIMVFPIENDAVSGNEIFCNRTSRPEYANVIYTDIKTNPKKYLSDRAIEKYLACKECKEWCCTMCKHFW